jgi:hypothetical protein
MQKRALEKMDRATFLNEETLFERQNDALNEIEKLLERCRNRLTLDSIDIAENYIKGHIVLKVVCGIQGKAEKFSAFFKARPVAEGTFLENEKPGCFDFDQPFHLEVLGKQANVYNFPVFAINVSVVKCKKKIIPSWVWFESLNHSDGVHGDHIFYSVDLTEENVLSLPKWEFHSFGNIGTSMQRGQCDHEKIKAASYDIDGLSNVNSEQFRGLLSEAKFEDFLEGIEIDLSPLSVGLCFDIVGNKRIDFLSLAFGPFDL